MTARTKIAAVLVIAATVSTTGRAQSSSSRVFGDILKRIPAQTNGLMLVNVDGLFDSPMGRRENWRQQALENRRGGLGLAPDISKAAVAVGLNYHSMDERWKVGLVQLRRDVPIKLAEIAAREGGYVETIRNTKVAWTPRNLYLFDFPDSLVGFVSPAERKSLVAWFQSALWQPRDFPPGFVDRAVFRADRGAQIVFSLDLADTVSVPMVEPWLRSFDEVKASHPDPSLLATRIASVKSGSLTVQVTEGIQGNLRIEFERDIDDTRAVARTLVLDLLADLGAELPEMKSWSVSFDKKRALELSGRLSEDSVRKILSLGNVPRLAAGSAPTASSNATERADTKSASSPVGPATNTPSARDKVATSQSYFRSVAGLIEGLKKTDRPTYRSAKLWYDRYAKQIEELPILGVDKELLDWGAMVARTMREMSSGINYYSQNHKYAVASDASGSYGGYGNSRAYNASVMKKQTDAMMSVDLDKRWQAVETSVAEMRRKMVEKYQVDF